MVRSYCGISPKIDETAFVAETACVIGDVEVGSRASLWFNVVIRGDVNSIKIGPRTNIQDGAVVHVTSKKHPTAIGADVTVGHNATLHGCTIEDTCLIGIGAIVLDGAVIGSSSLIAAGTLVSPGTVVPPRSLVMGSPGKVKRQLSDEECLQLQKSALNYLEYTQNYL